MIFFLLLFVGFPALNGAVDCMVNKGGCSQYCIDRTGSGGTSECGCDCYYQLAGDGVTCVPITDCMVDMLWMFDFSNSVADNCRLLEPYADFGLAPPDMTAFTIWRNEVASYYQAFSSEIASGEFRIATMVAGDELEIRNNYGDINDVATLETQIMIYPPTHTEICGDDKMFDALYNSFDHDQLISASLLEPSGAADETYTTRVAIVTMVSPLDPAVVSDEVRAEYAAVIHNYYDQIFVIGRNDTTELTDAAIRATYKPQLRQLSSCNTTDDVSCPYVFFVDVVADAFTAGAVEPMIDRAACISRKTVNVHSASCNNYDMTITIPSCMLGGLNKDDLHLNNLSCDGAAYASRDGSDIVFTVPYEDCSWDMESNMVDDVEYVTYSQTVTSFDFGDDILSVNLVSSCTFPRYTSEQLGLFNPVVDIVSGDVEESGDFEFEVLLYDDDTYTTPISDFSTGVSTSVLETMYFAAKANLPSTMKLLVKEIIASSGTDKTQAPTYDIMEDHCPHDDTFSLGYIMNDEVPFNFQMFEFSNTVNLANGLKTPVYFHFIIHACETTDTTDECTQACAARRKKRDTDADKPTHRRTIGPFFLGQGGQLSVDEVVSKLPFEGDSITTENFDFGASEDIQPSQPESLLRIYVLAPSMGTICLWLLLAIPMMFLTAFVLKCFMNMSPSKMVYPEKMNCQMGNGHGCASKTTK